MAVKKVLDLNTIQRPTLTITMSDEKKTVLTLTTPTEGLINEMQALAPELEAVLEKGDQLGQQKSYEIAAALLSCNNEGVKITPEELTTTYKFDLDTAVVFFSAYFDFISEITNEKN